MARTLATQATPEFAAQVGRDADARAQGVMNPGQAGRPQTGVSPAGYYGSPAADGFSVASPGAHVIVSCKIGDTTEKIDSTLLRENADWIAVKTQAGNRTIPKRQVLDMLELGQATKPAPDK
jgi:hypothetical protein